MKLDARTLVPPLAAAIIMALILTQTRDALMLSGAWLRARTAAAATPSPFLPLEQLLAKAPPPRSSLPRDPLRAAALPEVVAAHPAPRVTATKPAPPLQPVLTSIVFDADPRATVKWNGRDYSVRVGPLFADFRVVSIAREQVVLDRGAEPVVLHLPKRGEP